LRGFRVRIAFAGIESKRNCPRLQSDFSEADVGGLVADSGAQSCIECAGRGILNKAALRFPRAGAWDAAGRN